MNESINDSNGDPLSIGDAVYVVEHRAESLRSCPAWDGWGRDVPGGTETFTRIPERWQVIKAVIGYSRESAAYTVRLDSSFNLLRAFHIIKQRGHEVLFSDVVRHGRDVLILKNCGTEPLSSGFQMGCGCKLEDNQFQYCRLHQAASDIVSVMDAVLSHIALNGAIDAGHPLIALATKTVATVTTVTP